MMRWIEVLFSPSLDKIIKQELEHAKRQLLLAESSLDSAKALVDYNKAVIARLEAKSVPKQPINVTLEMSGLHEPK